MTEPNVSYVDTCLNFRLSQQGEDASGKEPSLDIVKSYVCQNRRTLSSHGDGREIKQIVRLTPSSISCSRLLLRVEVNMRCHPLSQLIQLPGIQSSGHTGASVTHNHTTLTSHTHQTIFTIITTDTTLTTQTSNITTNNPRSSILTINNLMF